MSPTAAEEVSKRLSYADDLLSDERLPIGIWPKCCAWLLRTAVERAIVALCVASYGAHLSTRAHLLTLSKYVDPNLAHATAALWYSLSRAAHHHDYELAPTADELRSWRSDAVQVTEGLLAALSTT
ncbi:MAG: hypothetical protein ABIQ18_34650 [Umezawaea sp.]